MLRTPQRRCFLPRLRTAGTQWKDPIKDLVGTFTASAETLGILLTLIAVLPEECTNQVQAANPNSNPNPYDQRLLVTAAQRSAFIKYLEDSMPYVLQLLLAYLQRSGANSEEHLKVRIATCCANTHRTHLHTHTHSHLHRTSQLTLVCSADFPHLSELDAVRLGQHRGGGDRYESAAGGPLSGAVVAPAL